MIAQRLEALRNALRRLSAVVACALTAASLLLLSALVARSFASAWARLALAAAVAALAPLLLRGHLARLVARRVGTAFRPRLRWTFAVWNAAVLAVLCLGFSASTGRALRRRGDWFLGEREGAVAGLVRSAITRAGRWMERFDLPDLPPAARALLADAPPLDPRDPSDPRDPPNPGDQPQPPAAPGDPPPVAPSAGRWFHPLAGPRRLLPPNAVCRFGAFRPGDRPAECDLGHCGVDLAARVGTPVYAVHDGVVLSVVRDERAGGRAGRFVKLSHKDGLVKTYYVHLDALREDLSVGDFVRGGELLGTVGLSGVKRSGPHLHFGLAVRWAGAARHRYVDPEPLLWHWTLPAGRPFPGGTDRSKYLASCASCSSSPAGCAPAWCGRSAASSSPWRATARRSTCGAVFVDELDAVPRGAPVVFSSHGVSPAVREQAAQRALRVIDATCPLVAKVHRALLRGRAAGCALVLIGDPGHDEVEGTLGHAPGEVALVSSPAEAQRLHLTPGRPLLVLTQTTLSTDDAAAVLAVLRGRGAALATPGGVCYATQNRQDAVRTVAPELDQLLVVGSARSANSARLVRTAQRIGLAAALIEDAAALSPAQLVGVRCVGLTAGASTPEALVRAVVARLRDELGATEIALRRHTAEATAFALPDGLDPDTPDLAEENAK